MSSVVPAAGRPVLTFRRVPQPGEIGHVGTCPLCADTPSARRAATPVPPCLACRDELRARWEEMRLPMYMARAVN